MLSGSPTQSEGKWPALLWTAFGVLLALSLWFSATAVALSLQQEWSLSAGQAAWLTMAVQAGFVLGALSIALLNLPDRYSPRIVAASGAVLAALANLWIPLFAQGFLAALIPRFATGFFLAWVYPVGMKIMATWTRRDRGAALGMLVGALTMGSALPHLVRAWGGIAAWKLVLYSSSALALAAAMIFLVFGRCGPYRTLAAPFRWSAMWDSFRLRPLKLANFGYLGHMWELYAMWTWIPVLLTVSYRRAGLDAPQSRGALAAFFVIAVGALGAYWGGRLADRWGRTSTTILSMAVSGSCAVTIGLFLDHPLVVTAVALLWGFSVIADSAQFSSAVSELGEATYMGTFLTTQTCLGFLLTMFTIGLVPLLVDAVGWEWAPVFLAVGPALGIVAMLRLKDSPEATLLAGGRG